MIESKYKKAVVKNKYCVAWCTEYRRALFVDDEMQQALSENIYEVCNRQGGEIKRLSIGANYVLMDVELPVEVSIHQLVRSIKKETYRNMCAKYPQLQSRVPSLWTCSYMARSYGSEFTEEEKAMFLKSIEETEKLWNTRKKGKQ